MTPRELLRRIEPLSATGPMTVRLTRAIDAGRSVWYETQKQHWMGWLAEYDGPGFYGREDSKRLAAFVYNHVQCAPMLLWLAEAAGVSMGDLVKAHDAVMSAGPRDAARCAALRRIIPWVTVEAALSKRAAPRRTTRLSPRRNATRRG